MNVILFVLGVYLVLDAIGATAQMDRGDNLNRFSRDILAGLSGMLLAHQAIHLEANWVSLFLAMALALFALPGTSARCYRFFHRERRSLFKRRESDQL